MQKILILFFVTSATAEPVSCSAVKSLFQEKKCCEQPETSFDSIECPSVGQGCGDGYKKYGKAQVGDIVYHWEDFWYDDATKSETLSGQLAWFTQMKRTHRSDIQNSFKDTSFSCDQSSKLYYFNVVSSAPRSASSGHTIMMELWNSLEDSQRHFRTSTLDGGYGTAIAGSAGKVGNGETIGTPGTRSWTWTDPVGGCPVSSCGPAWNVAAALHTERYPKVAMMDGYLPETEPVTSIMSHHKPYVMRVDYNKMCDATTQGLDTQLMTLLRNKTSVSSGAWPHTDLQVIEAFVTQAELKYSNKECTKYVYVYFTTSAGRTTFLNMDEWKTWKASFLADAMVPGVPSVEIGDLNHPGRARNGTSTGEGYMHFTDTFPYTPDGMLM